MARRAAGRRRVLAVTSGALLLALAACGAQRPSSSNAPPRAPDIGHIHEIGVNPADGSIVAATHAGVFSAALDQVRLYRLGSSRRDTMSLAVVGPDEFLGSGHAGSSSAGLLRSRDAGRRWSRIAVGGATDFHVLRGSGQRIFGLTELGGRLLISDDAGATWTRRRVPAPLLDVVARPGAIDEILASAPMMLFASIDGGRSWRAASVRHAGLLAWPREDALFVVDDRGVVSRSRDAGATWKEVGRVGQRPVAFAAHASELYVALRDDSIRMSFDGGRTWSLRARG
jgi:hypothetical protein